MSINSILAEYKDAINADVREITKRVAKDTAKKVKAAAPKQTGAYKRSISSRDLDKSANRSKSVVYSKDPHYRLTHLLEFGHAVVGKGGRTPAAGKKTFVEARPHWSEADRKAIADFEKQLKEAITK